MCVVFTFEKLQSTCTNRRQRHRQPQPEHQRSGKTQRTEPGQRVLFDILSYLAFIIVVVVLCCFMALYVLVLFSIELKNSYNPYNSPYARARPRQSNRLMARTEHKINAINVIKSLSCIIVWDKFSLPLSLSLTLCFLSCCFQVVSSSIKYVICSVFRCFFAVNQLRWESW